MANINNLKPCEHKFTREESKRGAQKSIQVRREKKQIQIMLNYILEQPIKKYSNLERIASEIGVDSSESIKSLLATACTSNSIKNAKISTLKKLAEMLGETH